MKKCNLCGKKKFSFLLDENGYCPDCSKWKAEWVVKEKERKQKEEQKRAAKWDEISQIPERVIQLSDVPRKRRKGFEEIAYSNITPRGVYEGIVVFDTETTGLSPSRDRIIELAAVRFDDGFPVERFRSFVNPERTIPEEVQKIHHITDDMVAGAPTIGQVLPAFEDFVGSSTLVAHNLDFDLRFLFYSGSVITDTKRRYIDTLEQAQRLLKRSRRSDYSDDYDVADHKLDTLCEYYHITQAKKHDALADAYATGELFFNLVDERRRRS